MKLYSPDITKPTEVNYYWHEKVLVEPMPEPKRGEWTNAGILTVYCSNCKSEFHELEAMNYCPNCGADMRKGRKENPLAGIKPKPILTKKHIFVYKKGTDDEMR